MVVLGHCHQGGISSRLGVEQRDLRRLHVRGLFLYLKLVLQMLLHIGNVEVFRVTGETERAVFTLKKLPRAP